MQPEPRPEGWRSLLWILLYVCTFAVGLQLVSGLLVATFGPPSRQSFAWIAPTLAFTALVLVCATLLATAVTCIAAGETLRTLGLVDPRWGRRLMAGFALGALLVSLAAGVPFAAGPGAVQPPARWGIDLVFAGLLQLCLFLPQSAAEELLVRGFPFRQLARWWGPHAAVFVTGAAFGLLHARNPAVSPLATANIALTGVFLGLLLLRTGTLWASIGVHAAWNWFEGFVWGQPVSGLQPGLSLLRGSSSAGPLLDGGRFGPEGSLVTTALVSLAVALLLWRSRGVPSPYDTITDASR